MRAARQSAHRPVWCPEVLGLACRRLRGGAAAYCGRNRGEENLKHLADDCTNECCGDESAKLGRYKRDRRLGGNARDGATDEASGCIRGPLKPRRAIGIAWGD